MTRTDIHRPSVINPDDYQFVSFHSHHDDYVVNLIEQERFRAHMSKTGGKFSDHNHGGSCHVCGAHAMTVAQFHHVPSNTYVQTGEDCAEKLHEGDALNFRSFRVKAKQGIDAAAGKRKANSFLENANLTLAWDIYNGGIDFDPKWEENTICDIVGKLVRYGSISVKQKSFLSNLLDRIADRPRIAEQRAAEEAAASPIPVTGRVAISGTVLSLKGQETMYGYVTKMLVQHDDGWKVWGTVPLALAEVEKGYHVNFTATITVDSNDPKFGFFKRPSVTDEGKVMYKLEHG
jgi:hypothetical protein